ncbi:MAG: M15 family metallopeptidase [Lachnospiraceae bacterium]|nr:M15 family metallopeptidase [Lachnospiraceae bacterium]
MNINQKKIIKMIAILALVCVGVGILSRVLKQNSLTLEDYANANPEIAYQKKETETEEAIAEDEADTDGSQSQIQSSLTGALLNSAVDVNERTEYTDGFYYEPLSDNLRRYITGVSFPEDTDDTVISYDDLTYVHIWHYDFNGEPAEGELICNKAIAQDLVEIFYELYRNEYQIEKVRLIDEYDGDDTASMEDNNTSCFNYRVVEGSSSLSKHAYGLAIDINPYYNPYITYENDGTQTVAPVSAEVYADRSLSFPYKIDDTDLCYKLFTQHGFIWGGDWNSVKDYQHFQKAID